ncbi:MAG: protein BatD, partial [Tannerella sp.]|nr:protein BatD [Tannerella sp.]
NYTNRENVQFLGKDIRYIKLDKPYFVKNKDIFFGSFIYILAYMMIAVLFIVFFIIYRKQVKENANIALVRTKKANKMAVKRLKMAEKLLKENKEEPFYEETLRALWGYLSDKLNISQSELTKENVSAELSKYGVNEILINEFLDIINTCEFARYAPSKSSGAMDKLFDETVDAIGKMENTIKKQDYAI